MRRSFPCFCWTCLGTKTAELCLFPGWGGAQEVPVTGDLSSAAQGSVSERRRGRTQALLDQFMAEAESGEPTICSVCEPCPVTAALCLWPPALGRSH
jgi:hypothetical protein